MVVAPALVTGFIYVCSERYEVVLLFRPVCSVVKMDQSFI